jgi:protoheme IX farnesyltransferase
MATIKDYYILTKPGIIYGNLVAAVGGFFIAAQGNINGIAFIATIIGLGCIIGSACVFNNILDRFIDTKMPRTKHRALPTRAIRVLQALLFGKVLLLIGSLILYTFTNTVALLVALSGVIMYVLIYGWAKRTTPLATEIGSIAGATPPVVGYTAVTNTLDTTAFIIFLLLVFWQMPHFFAIALFRQKEYALAHLPIISLKCSFNYIHTMTTLYTLLFVAAGISLYIIGAVGLVYLCIFAIGAFLAIRASFSPSQHRIQWARRVFKAYMFALLLWSAGSCIDSFF